jgi:hypothetical protein
VINIESRVEEKNAGRLSLPVRLPLAASVPQQATAVRLHTGRGPSRLGCATLALEAVATLPRKCSELDWYGHGLNLPGSW